MRALLITVVVLLIPGTISSQASVPAAPNRIWVRELRPQGWLSPGTKGSFDRAVGDTVFLRRRLGSPLLPITMTPATRIQIVQGTRRATGRYAFRGGMIGAGFGVLAGLTSSAGCSGGGFCFDRGSLVFVGGILFGVIGTGVGAIVGTATHTESWSEPMSPSGVLPRLEGF
jgi:hypothetical protein